MTEPTCNDSETTKPLTDRLRAAANGESFQLHWLVEAAREIDRLGLELMMIEVASPDEWSRRIARDARARTSEKASSGTPPLMGPQPDPERLVVAGVGPEATEVIRQIMEVSKRKCAQEGCIAMSPHAFPNELSIKFWCAEHSTCPREGCPYVGGPDFSIGNPCRCKG